MERPTSALREEQVRTQLKEEQQKYILCITDGKDLKEIKKLKERIAALQQQLNGFAGGYRGL
jgi:hypothetical protein